MSKRTDHAEAVAQVLIDQLQKGTSKFQRPWKDSLNSDAPRNGITGKKYKGINALYLDAVRNMLGKNNPNWYTFNNIRKLPVGEDGKPCRLRKGSKAVYVEKWTFEKEEKGPDGQKVRVRLDRPFVQYWPVFNGDDIIGLKPYVSPDKNPEWADVNRCEALLQDVFAYYRELYKEKDIPLDAKHSFLRHGGKHTDEAYYSPHLDYIQMPEKSQFDNEVKYYTVAFHELGHSTGHHMRLGRDLTGRFGSEEYAKEELRAEIASMLLGDALGIGHDGERHAAYVKSWIKVLKDDPQEIFRAAREAENIAAFVLKREKNKPLEAEDTETPDVEVAKPVTQTVSPVSTPAPAKSHGPKLRFRITGLEKEFEDLPSAMQAFVDDADVIMKGHDFLAVDGEKTYHLIGHDWVNDGSDHRYEFATPSLKAYHTALNRPKVTEEQKAEALAKASASLPAFIEKDELRQAKARQREEERNKATVPVAAMSLPEEPVQAKAGPWKNPADLVEGDVIVERNENGLARVSVVDEVRFIRDAMVHVDFDNGARTSIYPSERKLRVATLEEQDVMAREGVDAAFPRETQVTHLPEMEKLTMDWVMRVMDKAGPQVSFQDMGITTRDDGRFTKFNFGSTHLAYLDKGVVSRKALSDALYMNIYSPSEDGKDFFVWASQRADDAVEVATTAQFEAFKAADARYEAELQRVYGKESGDARYLTKHKDAEVEAARQGFYQASNTWHEAVLDARAKLIDSLRPGDWQAQAERHAGVLNWLAEEAVDANPGYNPMESFRVLQAQAQEHDLRPVGLMLPTELNGAFQCARIEYYKPDGERVPVYTDIGPDGKCLSHVGSKRVPNTWFTSDDESMARDLRVALGIVAGDSVQADIARRDLQVQEDFERRMSGLPSQWNGEIALEPAVNAPEGVRAAKEGEMPNLFGVYAFDGSQAKVWLSDVADVAEAEKFVSFLAERRPLDEPRLIEWSEVQRRERMKVPAMHMHARRDEDLRSYPVMQELIQKFEHDKDPVKNLPGLVAEYAKPLLIEHLQVQQGTHASVVMPELREGNALNQVRIFTERQPELGKAVAQYWANHRDEYGREQQVLANEVMKTPGATDSPWDASTFGQRVLSQAERFHWEADNEQRRRNAPVVPEVMCQEWAYQSKHLKSRTLGWDSHAHRLNEEQKAQLNKDIEDCRSALDNAQAHFIKGDWDKGLGELGAAMSIEALVNQSKYEAEKKPEQHGKYHPSMQFFMQDLYFDVKDKWRKWQLQNEVGESITPRMQQDFNAIPKDLSKLAPGMHEESTKTTKTKARRAGRGV